MAENTQAQAWSRTKSKFYKLRAQWPGRKRGTPLRFCAPEGFCQPQGISPVNGVLGGGEYGHEVSILSRSPSGSLVTFWPSRKSLAARGRRNLSAHNRPNPKSAPSSVTASPCPPTPFGLRPFPPDRGNRPSPSKGEGFRATARVAPTAKTGLEALARQSQAQKWNRISPNFPPAQAPSGAGRNRTQALLILRAGRILLASRGNPRKWGTGGKANMDTECPS